MNRDLLKCNSVEYRKGYIEVAPNIHPNCINIELWEISAEKDISNLNFDDENSFVDKDVVANIELELSIQETKALISKLSKAIKSVENAKDT